MLQNLWWRKNWPNCSGSRKLRREKSSWILFCKGVPVKRTRWFIRRESNPDWRSLQFLFLILWASSRKRNYIHKFIRWQQTYYTNTEIDSSEYFNFLYNNLKVKRNKKVITSNIESNIPSYVVIKASNFGT